MLSSICLNFSKCYKVGIKHKSQVEMEVHETPPPSLSDMKTETRHDISAVDSFKHGNDESVSIEDKRHNLIKYITQCVFSLLLFIFSAIQILRHPDGNNEVWVSLISGIAGIFLPHPTI